MQRPVHLVASKTNLGGEFPGVLTPPPTHGAWPASPCSQGSGLVYEPPSASRGTQIRALLTAFKIISQLLIWCTTQVKSGPRLLPPSTLRHTVLWPPGLSMGSLPFWFHLWAISPEELCVTPLSKLCIPRTPSARSLFFPFLLILAFVVILFVCLFVQLPTFFPKL